MSENHYTIFKSTLLRLKLCNYVLKRFHGVIGKHADRYDNYIIVGDFNVDLLKSSTTSRYLNNNLSHFDLCVQK